MTHSIRDIGCRPAKSWAGYLSVAAMLALVSLWLSPQAALSAEKKDQQISRVIAKEMTAAQKALQASQWAEALKNLEAAEQKSPLTPFDKKTIFDFKGFANVRLNHLKRRNRTMSRHWPPANTPPRMRPRPPGCCSV